MPAAFRSLDLSDYDLVISDSHAFSKAVRTRDDAIHLCYCHTPPRYLWDLKDAYLPGFRGRVLAPVVRWLRSADLAAASGVSHFIANSSYVAGRISRIYDRPAEVIYPPVDVDLFRPLDVRTDRFVAGGRMVPYKRIDLAVRAATEGNLPLQVFGDGPQRAELRRLAGPTVEFLGELDQEEMESVLGGARALLFPGVEDFGIIPVEAQAAGAPVVAYGEGGSLETVMEGRTGCFFSEPTVASVLEAIEELEGGTWNADVCRGNALRFSRQRFEREIATFIGSVLS